MNDPNGGPMGPAGGAPGEVDMLPWERRASAPEPETPPRRMPQPDEHSHFQEIKSQVHRKLL